MEVAISKPTPLLSPLGLDVLDWYEDMVERPVLTRGNGFCPSVESYVKDNNKKPSPHDLPLAESGLMAHAQYRNTRQQNCVNCSQQG